VKHAVGAGFKGGFKIKAARLFYHSTSLAIPEFQGNFIPLEVNKPTINPYKTSNPIKDYGTQKCT
jgi:hypothetical protein